MWLRGGGVAFSFSLIHQSKNSLYFYFVVTDVSIPFSLVRTLKLVTVSKQTTGFYCFGWSNCNNAKNLI